MILHGLPPKVVVLRDAPRDCLVGILALTCATLHLYIMQFVVLNVAREQKMAASMNVPGLVEMYASQNVKLHYSTSLYHVDTSRNS